MSNIKDTIQHNVDLVKLGGSTPWSPWLAVLEKGKVYDKFATIQPELSTPKECYSNSMRACFGLGYVLYVEGFIIRPTLPILIHHAWVVNSAGEILEPTLKEPELHEYMGIEIPDVWELIGGHYGVFEATDFIESLGYKRCQWLE